MCARRAFVVDVARRRLLATMTAARVDCVCSPRNRRWRRWRRWRRYNRATNVVDDMHIAFWTFCRIVCPHSTDSICVLLCLCARCRCRSTIEKDVISILVSWLDEIISWDLLWQFHSIFSLPIRSFVFHFDCFRNRPKMISLLFFFAQLINVFEVLLINCTLKWPKATFYWLLLNFVWGRKLHTRICMIFV